MAIIPRFKNSPETPLTAESLNLIIDELENVGNGDNVPSFENKDTSDNPAEPLEVERLSKTDSISIILTKISKMFQNIRYLLNQPRLIERGTENGWIYEKWSDGVAKCWGIISNDFSTANGSTTMPATTHYNRRSKNFPNGLFVSIPIVLVSATDIGTGVDTASVEATTKETCAVILWGSQEAIGNANVFAIGNWK